MADRVEFIRANISGASQVLDQKTTGSDVSTVSPKSNIIDDKIDDKDKLTIKDDKRDNKIRLDRRKEDLKSILNKINDVMRIFDIERRYQMERVMHQVVVKFVDVRENRVIDQIPPEEVIRRYHRMIEYFRKVFGL